MNKILFCSLALMAFLGLYAQEENEPITKVEIVKNSSKEYADAFGEHEIRLNSLDLVVHPALHLYYERIVNESNGYGVSLFANFGDDETTYQDFALTPYYRFYFLDRKDFGASGMFVEIFSSFASANFHRYDRRLKDESEFQFSMGIALGKKWVNRNGVSFEAFAGVGRYFSNEEGVPDAHGRFGLAIGKRF
jgi:hypothetical protein